MVLLSQAELCDRQMDQAMIVGLKAVPLHRVAKEGDSTRREARVIATRPGSPPAGYANWTLRLLARRVVELEIVRAIHRETIRRTLRKTA